MKKPRLTYANVMSTMAFFLALGGVGYAAVSIPANSVGTRQIVDKSVGTNDLADKAVTSGKLDPAVVGLFKGQKGDVGPQGVKGDKGSPGQDGAQGPAGSVISLIDVDQGERPNCNPACWVDPATRSDSSGIVASLQRDTSIFTYGSPPIRVNTTRDVSSCAVVVESVKAQNNSEYLPMLASVERVSSTSLRVWTFKPSGTGLIHSPLDFKARFICPQV